MFSFCWEVKRQYHVPFVTDISPCTFFFFYFVLSVCCFSPLAFLLNFVFFFFYDSFSPFKYRFLAVCVCFFDLLVKFTRCTREKTLFLWMLLDASIVDVTRSGKKKIFFDEEKKKAQIERMIWDIYWLCVICFTLMFVLMKCCILLLNIIIIFTCQKKDGRWELKMRPPIGNKYRRAQKVIIMSISL